MSQITKVLDANYVNTEQLPWIPTGLGSMEMKLCKVNLVTGQYVLLVKDPIDFKEVPAHHHHGTVIVYTIKGQWKYENDDWIAGPGDVIYEPAGSTHKPIHVSKDEEVITCTIIEGCLEIVDEKGNIIAILNAHKTLDMYLYYCKEHGIEPIDVTI
ncbi:2,4'-dihydroxyacetophenone dioxygenase family protein [Gottfriedia sp. NPDC057991]|uniref:2,4'-dihydroxyacetophenone dioxygenase family protein n=1 Tax=Gottfriedia sp. NPDC057991 TaxID=3346298 RepID=UPI0036DCD702